MNAAVRGDERNLASLPLLVAAVTFVLLFLTGLKTGWLLGDPGALWHVRAGELILESGIIPRGDPFSFTAPGAPWHPFEWLSEVVLALAYRAGGTAGLVTLAAALAALAMALLVRFLLARIEPAYALFAALFALLGLASHALARPHLLALPIFVFWVGKLVEAVDQGRRPSLKLVPLATLWANLHGGFPLGISIAGLLALDAVVSARDWPRRIALARVWAAFLALVMAASLVTPLGLDGALLSYGVFSNDVANDQILEWRSPNFRSYWGRAFELWLLGSGAAALALGVRLPPVRIALLVVLLHLALSHSRFVATMMVLTPLIVVAPLAPQLAAFAARRRQATGLDGFMRGLARPAHPAAVAAAVALAAASGFAATRYAPVAYPAWVAPEAAVAAVQRHPELGRVFNHINFGGYLIRAGVPVFIDDRTEIYDPDLVRDYHAAVLLRAPDRLAVLLEKWRIDWTLFYPETPIVAMLDRLDGWQRLFADERAVVHVRRAALAEAQRD